MSVSQYNQYGKCPYAWKLQRRDKVWERPAAWLPQGTAVHAAGEAYERSGRTLSLEQVKDVFRASYSEEVSKYTKETPNLSYWFRSGPYRGAQDIERRFGIGLEQCEKYVTWYDKHPEQVAWTAPDGTLGVELEFDLDLDGVLVKGFIDKVGHDTKRDVMYVRDNKTGKKPPEDDMQLGTYKVAVETTYGVEVPEGDFWMGSTGKPTIARDLKEWTRERVTEKFHELADNIKQERFDPDPETSKCMFCSVSASCAFSA
ncbi:RecB family exonuclease [Nocardia sp. NPDC059246]|uniref:RecB family exonuclease n=1 Tax=unclassified Nocardia TaxID=2637762 RepID=UPI0036C74CDD